ncbi:MAG TPA: CPBP family glutamic-type intramembrane protease [Patescibacteria group bacterium]|nr:CPBP family glutamic-type intramembrane protease [Patescibacteria group bacterium]
MNNLDKSTLREPQNAINPEPNALIEFEDLLHSKRDRLTNQIPADVIDKFMDRARDMARELTLAAPSEFKQNTSSMDTYGRIAGLTIGLGLTAITASAIDLNLTAQQYTIILQAIVTAPLIEEFVFRGLPADFLVKTLGSEKELYPAYGRYYVNTLFASGHNPKDAEPFGKILPISDKVVSSISDLTWKSYQFVNAPFLSKFLWASFQTKLAAEGGIKRSILSHSLWNSTVIGLYMTMELASKHYPEYAQIASNTALAAAVALSAAAITEGIKNIKDDYKVHEMIDALRLSDSLSNISSELGKYDVMTQKLLSVRRHTGYKFAQGAILSRLVTELEMAEYTQPGNFRLEETKKIFQQKIIATAPSGITNEQLNQRLDHAMKIVGFRESPTITKGLRHITTWFSLADQSDTLSELKNSQINPVEAKKYIMRILQLNPHTLDDKMALSIIAPLLAPSKLQSFCMKLYRKILELEVAEFSWPSSSFQRDWINRRFYTMLEESMPYNMTLRHMEQRINEAIKIADQM